jgi:SAM-dependent methyltransferase
MKYEPLLAAIADYCRHAGMAESTFGRHAVNDGKLVQRLREGRRITTDTLDRIQAFLSAPAPAGTPDAVVGATPAPPRPPLPARDADVRDPQGNFRFFDNRQKYLLFVTTCSEKRVIAQRVALELASIHPHPPAVRMFDAGAGDGTVLSRVLRAMHGRFPHMPCYVAAKEISLEDARLTLDKIPDRLAEHPASVMVLTNMYYAEAPWLTAQSPAAAASMVWRDVALTGTTAADFEAQIGELRPFLDQNWRASISPKSGNPVYERPIVIVLYRDDHRFLLDPILPRPGRAEANFDLIIASQPYRARSSAMFKARRVIAPLARALRPGGRLIGIHSYGHDPGMEIIDTLWPGENPFITSRHDLLRAVRYELGSVARTLNFNAYADSRSIFRYDLETLPNEVAGSIGTSTLFAAWNAAIYVAQVEDERLTEVAQSGRYLDVTRDVLRRHNGLWFRDESFVISRRRD